MLNIFDKIVELDKGFSKLADALMSDQRREKVSKIRYESGKVLHVAAFLLLRIALLEVYGINEPVVFEYSDNGKPVLRDHPHIHFNLSHCKYAVACAISDSEIGVDVQDIRSVSDTVAKRVLTAEEYAGFIATSTPDEYFCEIWAVKEAHLKQTGQGIGAVMSEFSAGSILKKTVFRGKDYYCCVSEPDAKIRYVDINDFDMLKKNH